MGRKHSWSPGEKVLPTKAQIRGISKKVIPFASSPSQPSKLTSAATRTEIKCQGRNAAMDSILKESTRQRHNPLRKCLKVRIPAGGDLRQFYSLRLHVPCFAIPKKKAQTIRYLQRDASQFLTCKDFQVKVQKACLDKVMGKLVQRPKLSTSFLYYIPNPLFRCYSLQVSKRNLCGRGELKWHSRILCPQQFIEGWLKWTARQTMIVPV